MKKENRTVVLNIYWDFSSELLIKGTLTATAHSTRPNTTDRVVGMSALGHKQTCALHKPMSALHPKATAKADLRKTPCLLYPRKRTCGHPNGYSAVHLKIHRLKGVKNSGQSQYEL